MESARLFPHIIDLNWQGWPISSKHVVQTKCLLFWLHKLAWSGAASWIAAETSWGSKTLLFTGIGPSSLSTWNQGSSNEQEWWNDQCATNAQYSNHNGCSMPKAKWMANVQFSKQNESMNEWMFECMNVTMLQTQWIFETCLIIESKVNDKYSDENAMIKAPEEPSPARMGPAPTQTHPSSIARCSPMYFHPAEPRSHRL